MKPPKEPKKSAGRQWPLVGNVQKLFGGPLRWISIPLAVAGLLAIACTLLWRQVREHVVTGADYQVTRESIELTPAPPWIHTHVAGDVMHQMNLSGPASLLDDDLCERLAKAFALHPWIAEVVRVEKHYPAKVDVEVVYRRPVCMVEVPVGPDEVTDPEEPGFAPGDVRPTRVGGLYPIDVHGVLLPTADFSRAEAAHYPRLSDIQTLPLGPVGTAWGDARVTGAAEIAAVLLPDWERLRLHRIVPSEHPESGGSSDDFSFDLIARDGSRVLWGQRPTSPLPGEVSAAEKLERLRKHLSQASESNPPATPMEIDIRYQRGVSAAPRTASKNIKAAK